MAEYIERYAAIDSLTADNIVRNLDSVNDGLANRYIRAAQRVLASLPTADVRPVVHGEWDWIYPLAQCSNCKATMILTDYSSFCPSCGSDMRGKDINVPATEDE